MSSFVNDHQTMPQGSAIGGAIHPIMLNKWFHGALGFHNGVRASASLTFGLLVVSLLLMRPQYPQNTKKAPNTLKSFKMFLTEFPYVVMVLGYVLFCFFLL